MTKGLVWLEDVHYNVCKFDGQCSHVSVWDNLGFDGPRTYRDLSYDVPDNHLVDGSTVHLAYPLETQANQATIPNVTWTNWNNNGTPSPTGAIVTFNWYAVSTSIPSVRVNDGPWIDTPWPYGPGELSYGWRTIAVPVPIDANNVRQGANTIQWKTGDGNPDHQSTIANINLIVIAGSPVP